MSVKIGIVLGSTRPGGNGEPVAMWVDKIVGWRRDGEFELVDVADCNLPYLDEPLPPSVGHDARDHTEAWASKIAEFDGYLFVTPEYNHSTSGVLKNAIDFRSIGWNNKAAGFVSDGSVGGTRAVEHLRLITSELPVATVRAQVALSRHTAFENDSTFRPSKHHVPALQATLDPLIRRSRALRSVREPFRATA